MASSKSAMALPHSCMASKATPRLPWAKASRGFTRTASLKSARARGKSGFSAKSAIARMVKLNESRGWLRIRLVKYAAGLVEADDLLRFDPAAAPRC